MVGVNRKSSLVMAERWVVPVRDTACGDAPKVYRKNVAHATQIGYMQTDKIEKV